MAVEVTGAQIKGTNSSGVPFVQGSDNLIKITIDDPINLNLDTFKNNILPYLDGNNNVVNIEIIGTEVFVENIELTNDFKLKISKKTVNGPRVEYIQLPYVNDGEIVDITFNRESNLTGQGRLTVNYSIEGAQGEPFIKTENYNVNETDGIITSITKYE